MQYVDHRIDQTAHISLQKLSISKNARDKINRMRLLTSGAPGLKYLSLLYPPRNLLPKHLIRFASREHICAVGERVFTSGVASLQPLFSTNSIFFCLLRPRPYFIERFGQYQRVFFVENTWGMPIFDSNGPFRKEFDPDS
ncbi:MAG: hypothetical protein AAF066_11640 [Pseudomonadota bacterium]